MPCARSMKVRATRRIRKHHERSNDHSPLEEAPAKRVPTVYFIDDSATIREVIKIASRRENIQVITCADAASALRQFEQTRPHVVITDFIMQDQYGYSVCSQIKEDPELSSTAVLLMSGVLNKS